MEAGGVGAQAGDRFGTGGLLGLEQAGSAARGGEHGHAQQGSNEFHEWLP
jgi:hypothetical protein